MSGAGNKIVNISAIEKPIARSPGFEKKELSTYKLDIMGLCQFQCRYCSSNAGNYLRINRTKFKSITQEQLGINSTPDIDHELMFVWPDVINKLKRQLESVRDPNYGRGHTLVFSMLTDGFSPYLVKSGITENALTLLLESTHFKIRVLTKNAIVGSPHWINFFSKYPDRFVVGLSIGTLDDQWSKKMETGTSIPSARIKALKQLQEADIPTYGMLCPIFPDMLKKNRLERLIDLVNPEKTEAIWAEPFNNRQNWKVVRDSYDKNSNEYRLLTRIYEERHLDYWSEYATDLYLRLKAHALNNGWEEKLKYLLYEKHIDKTDADRLFPFSQILFQNKTSTDATTGNSFINLLLNRKKSLTI